MEERNITERLRKAGQEHVQTWLDGLAAGRRESLMAQLSGLDFERLRQLAALVGAAREKIDFQQVSPAPVHLLPSTEAELASEHEVAQVGRDALAGDRVAVLTAAGGQATRLGYDAPKGTYPITPVLKKSLFQFHAEKILAARRCYGCRLPWFIMTNSESDAQTREFFRTHEFFGLGDESVHFFAQQMNPILGEDGKLLRQEEDRLLVGPDGHGGVYEALLRTGALEAMERGGWDLIGYFQVDNPLVPPAGERFLGHHILEGAEFSCKVVAKRNPQEGLGLAVLRRGRPAIVEYVDVPPGVAAERDERGRLKFLYGSIAAHVINVAFVRRMAEAEATLPWHVARKRYRVLSGTGKKAVPQTCHKFERFIFDALLYARGCAFVEVERRYEFAPVKNATGEDSPQSARRMMQQMWADWLCEAGIAVRDGRGRLKHPIEVSPLFARGPEELKAKLPGDWRVSGPVVLGE